MGTLDSVFSKVCDEQSRVEKERDDKQRALQSRREAKEKKLINAIMDLHPSVQDLGNGSFVLSIGRCLYRFRPDVRYESVKHCDDYPAEKELVGSISVRRNGTPVFITCAEQLSESLAKDMYSQGIRSLDEV